MLVLTAENALSYLRQAGRIGDVEARAELLSGGVSNQVLRICLPDRCFVLKQSRSQLRTQAAWYSDLERIYREQEVMQALNPLLPEIVPEVLFVDRPNFVYAMSHAPQEAVVWKTDLLAGRIDPNLGMKVGAVLGRIHQFSADHRSQFETFRDVKVFVQLRVDPFYRRVQERCPEVRDSLEKLIEAMVTAKEALCHGDYTPKNMLVHEGSFTLVDYETAHLGDPTMDLGLLLTHLTLKAVRAPVHGPRYCALMRHFWLGYCQNIPEVAARERQRRGVKHLGACLLARVDGTSPVEYLPFDSQHALVRRLARTILLDGVEEWEQVWQWCQQELASATK